MAVAESAGSTRVAETSGSDIYTVVLGSEPAAAVTVTVTAPVGVLVDGPDVSDTCDPF